MRSPFPSVRRPFSSPGPRALLAILLLVPFLFASCDIFDPPTFTQHLLGEMARQGIAQGVVTNKLGTSARALIRHFGWEDSLSLCLGEHDGYELKPSPDMILAVAMQMGVAPRDLLFVGDSPFDREAGRRAGCPVILLTTGTHQEKELAALDPIAVVDSLWEVERWIRESGRVR